MKEQEQMQFDTVLDKGGVYVTAQVGDDGLK